MNVMILPLVVMLVADLLILSMVYTERFPMRSWPSRIRSVVRSSQEMHLEEQDVEVEAVPQEVSLSDLMTRKRPVAYVGTEGFGGLVDTIGKAMDATERIRGSAGSRRRAQTHEPATGSLSQPQS